MAIETRTSGGRACGILIKSCLMTCAIYSWLYLLEEGVKYKWGLISVFAKQVNSIFLGCVCAKFMDSGGGLKIYIFSSSRLWAGLIKGSSADSVCC